MMYPNEEGILEILGISFLLPVKISRRLMRCMVCTASCFFFLLYQLVGLTLRRHDRKRINRMGQDANFHMLHKSSHGLTAALNERDTGVLLTWTRIHCQGHRERIELLANLFWFRLVCKRNDVRGLTDFPGMSWMDVLTWATCTSSPTCFDDEGVLKRIVLALGMCHVRGLLWPECAIDILILHALAPLGTLRSTQSREASTRIRGELILMGVLRTHSDHYNGLECYETINIRSWDDDNPIDGQDDLGVAWESQLVDALGAVALLRNDSSRVFGIQPCSTTERSSLCRLLPDLFVHLGHVEAARRVEMDPFSCHCRLLGQSGNGIVAEDGDIAETIPPLISETNAAPAKEKMALLHIQVLWKQRCCDKIVERAGYTLAPRFAQAGLSLIRFPCHRHLAQKCVEEAKALQTMHLSRALQSLLNALHYTAQVLWFVGRPEVRSDTTLSTERILSRRIFALKKSLQSTTLQAQGFVEWIGSVKGTFLETASMEHVDVKQGHRRLATAIENFDAVYNQLLEISSIFSAER